MADSTKAKIDLFFSQFKTQKYRKGEILIRADDKPSVIFYLIEGNVKMYTISRKGDEVIVNVFKAHAFFPMSHALSQSPNVYYFEAMTDLTVVKAPSEKVIDFLKNENSVLLDLLTRVYRGMDGVLVRMSYLMAGSAHGRLITEILIESKRFGKKEGETVTLEISEKDLASLTGLTRETVSREMKILKENGLVEFGRNRLKIKNIGDLEDRLDGGV